MKVAHSFCIRFSGITIRFILPAPVLLHKEFSSFLCEDCGIVDAEYELQLLTTPLSPTEPPFYSYNGIQIYRYDDAWLRIYPMRAADDGCQIACLYRRGGKNILYYPAAMWDYYTAPLRCISFMCIEQLLLEHNAVLLHSSVVALNGKAVLFSGPSGAGKSTQADLWRKYLGADILNGDRCVIMKRPDAFYGGGSPWAGTSGIYCPEQFPIAGIFIINHAQQNNIARLKFDAFAPLFSQTLVNSWDTMFMEGITSLYASLLDQIPVYRLDCRPDEEAVQMACHAIF